MSEMRDKDFVRLYAEHAEALYAFLSYRTDRSLAEDLLAETFERALKARGGFDRRRGSERTWLYAIALNAVRDNGRRAVAEARALAQVAASPDASTVNGGWEHELDRKDALHRALDALGDREREAIALRFGSDLSLADVAAVIGEPRSTAESRIYAGLKKLRQTLGDDF